MHETSRALLKRCSIAAAITTLMLGSGFAAVPASATASPAPEQTRTETSASRTPEAPLDPNPSALPGGLREAVERDLGITIEEFYKNGQLSSIGDALAKDLKKAGLDADFAIAENRINVTVAASSLELVTKKLRELTRDTKVELHIATRPEAGGAAAPRAAKSRKTEETEAPKTRNPGTLKSATDATPQSTESLLEEFVANVEPSAVSQLQAVMKTGPNRFVIRTGGTAEVEGGKASATPEATAPRLDGKLSPGEFARQYSTVSIESSEGPAKAAAANDVLGGMGYGAPINDTTVALCSIGFSGFNAKGDDAVISAGHCTQDGEIEGVSILEHSAPNKFQGIGSSLGAFGFSQFGGPGNSPITGLDTATRVEDLGNVGTDISVIDKINPDLDLKPLVTQWKGADERDSGTRVTGVASAVMGTDICKSGRTTGWTCGTVDEVGIFFVRGPNGNGDIRGVQGFGMMNTNWKKADAGDSGGSVVAGGTAVGLTSAIASYPDDEGNEIGRAYFTDLKAGLKRAKGYSIALFLNAPTVNSSANGADVKAGARVSGTVVSAPAGSHVRVVLDGKQVTKATVSAGKFSFRAPQDFGKYNFTLQAINGLNKSSITSGSLNIRLGAPAITNPRNGARVNAPVSAIAGTGTAGATVTLGGDATGTVKVTPNGTWRMAFDGSLTYGSHGITAVQTVGETTSISVKSTFTVVPVAPTIDSPTDGQEFAFDETPKTISGFGINGSAIKVFLGDNELTAVVANGAWTVMVPQGLAPGDHQVSAVQVIDEVDSAATTITFSIAAAAAPEPSQDPTTSPAPEPSEAPVVPQGNINGDDSGNGGLANTGANSALPFIATGGALMVAGGLFILLRRKDVKWHHGA